MIPRAIADELRRRPLAAVLATLGVAAAVAMAVGSWYMAKAAHRETRVVQRDSGLNVRVIPAKADMATYWRTGVAADAFFPASYVDRLHEQDVANRLIPMLRLPVVVGETPAMLTGMGGEVITEGRGRKPVFALAINPGEVVLGGAVASSLGVTQGETITVHDTPMRVADVLRSAGSEEDAWIYANLADVQRMVGRGPVLNEIRAMECRCEEEVEDPLALLQSQLEPLLPGTRVVRLTRIADARATQRRAADRFARFAIPAATIVAAAWVGVLGWLNIRERSREVGVLRALGMGDGPIVALVVGRALTIALVGSGVGAALGVLVARAASGAVFEVTGPRPLDAAAAVLAALALTPLLAAVASIAPALHAASLDPARVLAER